MMFQSGIVRNQLSTQIGIGGMLPCNQNEVRVFVMDLTKNERQMDGDAIRCCCKDIFAALIRIEQFQSTTEVVLAFLIEEKRVAIRRKMIEKRRRETPRVQSIGTVDEKGDLGWILLQKCRWIRRSHDFSPVCVLRTDQVCLFLHTLARQWKKEKQRQLTRVYVKLLHNWNEENETPEMLVFLRP